MEILWKYYRSLSTAKDRRLNYVSKLLDASKKKTNASEETTPYDEGDVVADGIHLNNLLSVVDFELSADRVNEFVGVVESHTSLATFLIIPVFISWDVISSTGVALGKCTAR